MGYRNKTYIIFDGDNDMWAYGYMKGWKASEHIDFNFHDAHDLKPLTDRASDEEYIKGRLRERFSSAVQVIVLDWREYQKPLSVRPLGDGGSSEARPANHRRQP
jgi:hypothetical protein